jgi:NADH-quinone oxidoreductase subunit K
MEIQLLFAGMLFLIGLVGFLVRRNIIYMLLSIEIMLNTGCRPTDR